MQLDRRTFAAFALSSLTTHVLAQPKFVPSGPMKIVVPFPPGGGADTVARHVAEQMRKSVDVAVHVENRAGAGGLIGLQQVSRAAPDGLTLGYFISGNCTFQPAFRHAAYLPNLITPVCRLSYYDLAIIVANSSPHRTLESLLRAVAENPGHVSMGSSGPGSPSHLAWTVLRSKLSERHEVNPINYRGNPQIIQALVGKQLDFAIGIMGAFVSQLQKGGALRALAITSPKRGMTFPDVPTASETVPDSAYQAWEGLGVPPSTPKPLIDGLFELIRAIASTDEYRKFGERVAFTAAPSSSPEEFQNFVRAEMKAQEEMVRSGKLKLS